ncbi:hypothetical protein NEOLEDRAFT_551126 [Neolentinus lepideus HHB14362 ss-1]|uniref:Uncharacterized protein n=1 Tax=Neolentinus lepideus HHB14362 ss-1 TaxID=1314782 RepID=A0A165R427_9AGAM|nr:hypothetical protein NEOLEDRAFT_551126 [Neolentinus lepideus HHB14362 ss-1]
MWETVGAEPPVVDQVDSEADNSDVLASIQTTPAEEVTTKPRQSLADIVITDLSVRPSLASEYSYKTPTASSFQIPILQTIFDAPASGPVSLELTELDDQRDLSSSDLNPIQPTISVSECHRERNMSASSFESSTACLIPSTTSTLLVNASLSSIPPSVSTSSTNSSLYLAHQHPASQSRRRNAAITCSSKARNSLDLHTSFNIHLQAESSFDLLKDRISFLGDTSREEDLDIEEEEKAMEAIVAEKRHSDSDDTGEMPERATDVVAQPEKSVAAVDDDLPAPAIPQGLGRFSVNTTPETNNVSAASNAQESNPLPSARGSKKRRSLSNVSSPLIKEQISCAEIFSTETEEYGTPVPQTKARRLSAAGTRSPSTSAPLRPVPALRIIKRAATGKEQGHIKTDSMISVSVDRRSPDSEVAEPSAKPAAPVLQITRKPSIITHPAPVLGKADAKANTMTVDRRSPDSDATVGLAKTRLARRPSVAASAAPAPPKIVVKGVQRPAPGSKFTLASGNKQSAATTAGVTTQSAGNKGMTRSVTGPARITGVQRPPVPAVAASKRRISPEIPSVAPCSSSQLHRKPSAVSRLRAPSQSMQKLPGAMVEGGITKLPLPKSVSMASKLPSFGGKTKIATRTS